MFIFYIFAFGYVYIYDDTLVCAYVCIIITFHTLDILSSPEHHSIWENLNYNNKGKPMHTLPR